MPEDPNIHTHLRFHAPAPELVDDKEWTWPFRKFGYRHGGVLFTELHEEFNSFKCAIQDPYGWHLDVSEIAHMSNNREMFFSLLKKRQDERFAEIQSAWDRTASLLVGDPGQLEKALDCTEAWVNLIRVSRNFSFDSFLKFFSQYIEEEDRPKVPLPNPPNPERRTPQRPSPSQNSHEIRTIRTLESGQNSRTLERESQSTSQRAARTITAGTKGARTTKTPTQATGSSYRITRQTRRSKTGGGTRDGPRRSARLRERAERAERASR
ncbi:hypothetical protein GGS24DRAFT_198004 [Hypoxylon argillaceum]|nr:hypothetical protein GGS24DRAFT_198004 [Hypoxylon argillaceum]KAI1145803.1 hypothetical protein F4825DRAFT_473480 [Nemania diffusa]